MNTKPQPIAGGDIDGVEERRLVVPNSLSELRRVSEWVRNFALERKLNRDLVYSLELSVNEALTNIISYAYRDDAQHDIIVEKLSSEPNRIHVKIEDDGAPFNPLALEAEEPPQSLEKSRPTGRGIPLMRNLMDELHYVRNDNRNVLTMVMHSAKP